MPELSHAGQEAERVHPYSFGSNFPQKNYSVVGDADEAWSQLASYKVFGPESWTPTLDLIDLDVKQRRKDSKSFLNAEALRDHLNNTSWTSGTRFMYVSPNGPKVVPKVKAMPRSICQKNSWASLGICQTMLGSIIRKHNIMPDLLGVVRCFQDKAYNVEQAFGGSSWKKFTQQRKGMLLYSTILPHYCVGC